MTESRGATWEDKVWGRVAHLFYSDHGGLSVLYVNAGYRCSIHYHDDRFNSFFVASGSLLIENFGNNVDRLSLGVQNPIRHLLFEGEYLVIPPGDVHQFRTPEKATIVEYYWTINRRPVRLNDINRLVEGGVDKLAEIQNWIHLLKEER